ncbi:MAG: hypothetical protein HC849_04650 [Oscillatoriales cyanobacterium RU_3_3]|nr:hypothetical protein [Oscillatoriales cyanobacterium RU_3_3]
MGGRHGALARPHPGIIGRSPMLKRASKLPGNRSLSGERIARPHPLIPSPAAAATLETLCQ